MQQRLFEEITEIASKYDDKITHDALLEMQYLDGVLSETLRLSPVLFTMNKVCTKPYELPPLPGQQKKFVIPKGMPVSIPVYSMQK